MVGLLLQRSDVIFETLFWFIKLAVNDFLPGTRRAATLLLDGETEGATSVTTDIDTLILEEDETAGSRVASQVTFGAPTLNAIGLDVRVTNGDDAAHTMTVGTAVLRSGTLVGIGVGALNDIAAGQTKTASLLVTGEADDADEYVFYVDTIVE